MVSPLTMMNLTDREGKKEEMRSLPLPTLLSRFLVTPLAAPPISSRRGFHQFNGAT